MLRRFGGGGLAALVALRGGVTPVAARQAGEAGTVALACRACACDADGCACCLVGITGGGVVRTEGGEAQLVLFATRLEAGAADQGAGFVRWVDPDWEAEGLMLESVGPIVYEPVKGQDEAREVRGTMRVNGTGEYPFVLLVADFGPEGLGRDTAALAVGSRATEGSDAADFGYEAGGR